MDDNRPASSIELVRRDRSTIASGLDSESQADENVPASQFDNYARGGQVEQHLARADGGAEAWKILCAAFMFEAILWGEHIARYFQHPQSPVVDGDLNRLLGLIWCLSRLLHTASRIPGQPVRTSCWDNGIWCTLPWRSDHGCLGETFSELPHGYHLDRVAAMYIGTHRWFVC